MGKKLRKNINVMCNVVTYLDTMIDIYMCECKLKVTLKNFIDCII